MFVYFFQGARLVAPSALILVICGSVASAEFVLRMVRRIDRRTSRDLVSLDPDHLASGSQ
jgi:hypothetical protein